jgi:hypothetical protein
VTVFSSLDFVSIQSSQNWSFGRGGSRRRTDVPDLRLAAPTLGTWVTGAQGDATVPSCSHGGFTEAVLVRVGFRRLQCRTSHTLGWRDSLDT